MKTHRELEQIMRARYHEIEALFEQAACLFREGKLSEALELMRPLCLPDGHLDFLRTRGAIKHMASAFQAEERQAIRVALVALEIENQDIANGLIYFGAVENGRDYYSGRDDLMARDAVAVCQSLLERTESAFALWRDHLGDGLEFLAALLWDPPPDGSPHSVQGLPQPLSPLPRHFLDFIETQTMQPPPVYDVTDAVSKE